MIAATAGEYEITLRRWPLELNRPLNEGLVLRRLTKEGQQPQVVQGAQLARLKVADHDLTQPIADGATEVKFRVRLKAGQTRLQGWFINNQQLGGGTFGVYYVCVNCLHPL